MKGRSSNMDAFTMMQSMPGLAVTMLGVGLVCDHNSGDWEEINSLRQDDARLWVDVTHGEIDTLFVNSDQRIGDDEPADDDGDTSGDDGDEIIGYLVEDDSTGTNEIETSAQEREILLLQAEQRLDDTPSCYDSSRVKIKVLHKINKENKDCSRHRGASPRNSGQKPEYKDRKLRASGSSLTRPAKG